MWGGKKRLREHRGFPFYGGFSFFLLSLFIFQIHSTYNIIFDGFSLNQRHYQPHIMGSMRSGRLWGAGGLTLAHVITLVVLRRGEREADVVSLGSDYLVQMQFCHPRHL